MKVPLMVNPSDIKLRIVRNKTQETVDAPMRPTIWVQKDQFPELDGEAETWTKVPENEEREYIRCEFNSLDNCHAFRADCKDRQKYILTNSFLEQIYISHPDFFSSYPHDSDLIVMFVDMEVASKGDGFFPKPISNEILCIGYSVWKYANDGTKTKLKHKIIKGFNLKAERISNTTAADKMIIREFVQDVKNSDPDIIAGYNSGEFDFPYLIDRAKLIGESLKGTGRYNREMYRAKEEVKIPGRIHFDIYNSNAGVHKDQTLFGIKARTLKELSRFYKAKRTVQKNGEWVEEKLEDIEVPEHIENLLELFKTNPDKLYAYQDDDVYRSEWVGHVYIRNCITLAEIIGVPLEEIMTMYSSFVPKIFIARNMLTRRLINTESNFQRYNASNGSIARLGTKYEGALTGLYKDGYFPKVWKIDFSAMYPSAIQSWNLGPDTTSFVRKADYSGKYKFSRDSKYNWYRIPDKNFNCDVVIKVRNDIDGLLKTEIEKLRAERSRIKGEMRTCSDETRQILESQQYALKVILNSIYGVLGLKSSAYGDMMSALMVTGMCRWTTGRVIRKYRDSLVELDTDGLILDKEVNANETNLWLKGLMEKEFGIKNSYMEMEEEHYGRAYFYAIKNYIVEKDGVHIVHGSSLKASRSAKIVDRAIKLAIEHVFNNKPKEEVLAEALDFTGITVEDLEERVKLTMEPNEYEDPYDMKLLLARQMELKTGQVGTKGTQFNYVITKRQLPITELKPYYREGSKNYTFVKWVESIDEIDLKYYKELVLKALEKFGIRQNFQTNLFGEEYEDELNKKRNKPLDKVPDDDG